MNTLTKTNSSANTKKHFLSFLFFSIAVFVACSVFVSVFHNDDIKHETHPLNHSPVCQWINEGKLCNRNTTAGIHLDIFSSVSFITSFCILTADLLLLERCKEKTFKFNRFFLDSSLTTRAPPAK